MFDVFVFRKFRGIFVLVSEEGYGVGLEGWFLFFRWGIRGLERIGDWFKVREFDFFLEELGWVAGLVYIYIFFTMGSFTEF